MELITKHICKTSDIGVQENLFGGNMMSWLDEAGAIMASEKILSKSVVTKKISEVNFTSPVKVHDIVHIYGEVLKFGDTSITLHLKAMTHNPNSKYVDDSQVCDMQMVFVHIGDDGHSKIYPKFDKN